MGNTALLVLDLQNGIMSHVKDILPVNYLSQVAETVNAARTAGVKIIYVRTCFRAGHPEVSSRNLSFARISSFGGFVEGDEAVAFEPTVAPLESDVIVTKRRVSAFSGSDLDTVLRGLSVDSIALSGVATSGAVLSTLRQAADWDFKLTVLDDLCLDPDAEVHRVLVEKVFPRQAAVSTAQKWLQQLGENKE